MSHLAPADVAVAVRSFPRRLKELLRPQPDDRAPMSTLVRTGQPSAASLIHELATLLDSTDHDLREVLVEDRPVLAATPVPLPAVDLEQAVESAAARLAARIDAVDPPAWTRTGMRGGRSVSALDLAQRAAVEGGRLLRAVERALEDARANV